MSERNWGDDLVHLAGVAGLLAVIFAAGWGYIQLRTEQEVSEYYARQYDPAKSNEEIAELCARYSGVRNTECVVKAVEAREKWEKERRDLNAQEWMAWWAGWMTIVTGIGALAAIGALVWLRWTWSETRRAANISEQIGRDNSRAYVTIESAKYETTNSGVFISFSVKNIGRTAARFVRIKGTIGFGVPLITGVKYVRSDFDAFCGVAEPNSKASGHTLIFYADIGDGSVDDSHIALNQTGDIHCRLLWDDIFGDEHDEIHLLTRHNPLMDSDPSTKISVDLHRAYTGGPVDQEQRKRKGPTA